MAGMGLMGMGGAAGAGDAMAQLFDQRMQAAKLVQQDALVRLKAQEQADALQQNLEQKRQAEADRTQAAQENAKIRQEGQTRLSFQMKPIGAPMSPTEGGQAEALGMPVTHVPGQPVQQTTGFMPLPPGGTGMQPMGALSPVSPPGGGPPPPPGPAPMGPLMPLNKMMQTTADPSSPLSVPPSLARGATQANLEKQTADALAARKETGTENYRGLQTDIAQLRAEQAGNKQPTPHFTAQDRFDETGKPQSGVLNTLSGEWKSTPGQGSLHAPAGANQAAQLQQRKKDAIETLGQLDQAIDQAKDLIGPGAGRVSNLEQMIGNADPKVQALGTKMLLAKMKVDASIGGARAAASPQLLARWDNLLANKVTPEGLKSAVQAIREVVSGMSGETGGLPTVGGTFQGGRVLKVEKVSP